MSVYIIAEAGVNHNGNIVVAKKLIDEAKIAGADCIKFQTFKTENIVIKDASKAEYQIRNTENTESQYEMLKKLELTYDEFILLKQYCDIQGIDFMSTAFDLDSIDFLMKLGMDTWKIPSGEITNLPYLKKIAQISKKVILSTGMSNMSEIDDAIKVLMDYGSKDLVVLHCTTEYPAPYEEVNLNAMTTIKNTFNVQVGYSDHTKGIEIPIAAVAMGAKVIEKHFTLDRQMEGPDHKASLEPSELKMMINGIRNVELAMGDGIKKPSPSEIKNISIARKSIVACKNIEKGELFTEDNLTIKRPGDGISPMKWYDVIGKKAYKNFDKDELIEI